MEKLIDLDGQSEKDSSWAYLVSPSIEYNTGDMGPEVYFRPEVDNSVGSIRMHGHRIIFVDIFTQIALILSDASGDTVSQATTGTNQYMFYTKKEETVLVHGKHSLFQLRHTNGSCIMPIITMPMLVQVFL